MTPLAQTTLVALVLTLATAQAVGYGILPGESSANYRVTERLVGVDLPNHAVGVTTGVIGTIEFDDLGAIVPGSTISVDLSSLQSNESRRDNFLRRNTLQTDRFPMAVLIPTEIRGLPWPLPVSGTASIEIVGDLTIRDVTRTTGWAAEATFEDGRVSIQASTVFTFEDFDLSQPRVPVVLSVADEIRLEARLVLQEATE